MIVDLVMLAVEFAGICQRYTPPPIPDAVLLSTVLPITTAVSVTLFSEIPPPSASTAWRGQLVTCDTETCRW